MSTQVVKEFKVAGGALAVLKEVSFKEFIAELGVEKAYNTVEQYNSQLSYGSFGDTAQQDNKTNSEQDSNYVRSFGLVEEVTEVKLFGDLVDGASFKDFPFDINSYSSDGDRVEAATLQSIENFGVPTHLVQLTNKTFAVLCKEDWKLRMLNDKDGVLLGYSPLRNIMFKRYGY